MTTEWADIIFLAACFIAIPLIVLVAVFDGDDFPE